MPDMPSRCRIVFLPLQNNQERWQCVSAGCGSRGGIERGELLDDESGLCLSRDRVTGPHPVLEGERCLFEEQAKRNLPPMPLRSDPGFPRWPRDEPWWVAYSRPSFALTVTGPNDASLLVNLLMSRALVTGERVEFLRRVGRAEPAELERAVSECGYRLLYEDGQRARLYVGDRGYVELAPRMRRVRRRRRGEPPEEAARPIVTLVVTSLVAPDGPNPLEVIREKLWPLIERQAREDRNEIYVLGAERGGLEYLPAGQGGVPLERDNYTEAVLKKFDRVTAELSRPEPFGRFVLIDGPPGAGKTFLVRGLVAATPGLHVVVPPDLVARMGDPDLVGAVLSQSRQATTFILEDADRALLPRMTDNLAPLAALLNLGDGLLGRVLNIRVIATTNASAKIEPALMRKGRLVEHIRVEPLVPEHVRRILVRLVGEAALADETWQAWTRQPFTLAEVYDKARELGAATDVSPEEPQDDGSLPFPPHRRNRPYVGDFDDDEDDD